MAVNVLSYSIDRATNGWFNINYCRSIICRLVLFSTNVMAFRHRKKWLNDREIKIQFFITPNS